MKAITAINAVIILVIAVITIMAIVIFFLSSYNPAVIGVNLETAKNDACKAYVSLDCPGSPENIIVNNFDADQDGTIDPGKGTGNCGEGGAEEDNLLMLCKCYYGINDPVECGTLVCGCRE